METEKLTNYQKNKTSIYKWRDNNRENFLLKQHEYYKNKLLDEDKRIANLERIKEKRRKMKEDEFNLTGIIKKVGRPKKYE